MHTPGQTPGTTSVQARNPLLTASTPRVPRRAYRHLRTRRRVLPLLVGLTLTVGLLISGLAYLGARFNSITAAQQTLAAHAHTAKHVLLEQGGHVALRGGDLVVSSTRGASLLVLDDDTSVVAAVGDLTGADATIYALRDGQFVAVSATDREAMGTALPAVAASALAGKSDFSGVIAQAGADYVTDVTPLVDASGSAVGAIGVGRSLGEVLAPAHTLGLALLGASALAALLALLAALRFSGTLSNAALAKLDERLSDVAASAADLEQMVRAQVGRAQRQERLARQVTDCARELNTLMDAVEQGQAALRESASEIWAGMSLPGQMLDPAVATRLARQSAVVAGRIGSATEDARERYRVLSCMMNQVIAEGRVLGDEGRAVEERANRLRLAIERVEMALGARVVGRQYDLPGHPFARRLRRPSRGLSGPHQGRQGVSSRGRGRHRVPPADPALPAPSRADGASDLGTMHPRVPSGIYKLDAANGVKLDPATPPPSALGAWGGAAATNPANPGPRSLQPPAPGTPGNVTHPRPPIGPAGLFGPPPASAPGPQGARGPQARPGAGEASRLGSSPLWSESGLRPASFSGGALPGLSLPGVSQPGGLAGLYPPSAPSPGQPPRPGAPSAGNRPPGGAGGHPAPRTDWINGQRSNPGATSAGNGARPWWSPPGQPAPPGQPGQSAPHTGWLND